MACKRPLGTKKLSPLLTGNRGTSLATLPSSIACFELRRLHARPQPGENLRAVVSGGEIPELALRFPA